MDGTSEKPWAVTPEKIAEAVANDLDLLVIQAHVAIRPPSWREW